MTDKTRMSLIKRIIAVQVSMKYQKRPVTYQEIIKKRRLSKTRDFISDRPLLSGLFVSLSTLNTKPGYFAGKTDWPSTRKSPLWAISLIAASAIIFALS
jgi:hypothetical protein